MKDEKKNRLFVYGTLKNDKGIKASVHGDIYDLGCFPGVLKAGVSERWVHGEIHEVSDERLLELDDYEGVGWGHYRRIKVEAFTSYNAESLGIVWIYEYAKGKLPEETRCNPEWNSAFRTG